MTMADVLMASIAATVAVVLAALAVIAGVVLTIAGLSAWIGRSHRRAAVRELDRLQQLNAWQHWPAPQSPAELEQQVAGSRDAREWARRNPDLARELAQVLAGHE